MTGLRTLAGLLVVAVLLHLVQGSTAYAQEESPTLLTLCYPIDGAEGMGLGTRELTEAEFQEQYGGVLPPYSWFPSEQGCFDDAMSNRVIFDENGIFIGFDTMTHVCEVQPDGSYVLESWPTRWVETGEVSFEPGAIVPAPVEGCPSAIVDAPSTSVESPAPVSSVAEQAAPALIGEEPAPASAGPSAAISGGTVNVASEQESTSTTSIGTSSNSSDFGTDRGGVMRLPSTGHGNAATDDLSFGSLALLALACVACVTSRMTVSINR